MPAEVERVVQLATLLAWEELIAGGQLLTDTGLRFIRQRLQHDVSLRCEEAQLILIMLDDAIGTRRDIDPADLPGSPLAVPDTIEGIDVPPGDPGRW